MVGASNKNFGFFIQAFSIQPHLECEDTERERRPEEALDFADEDADEEGLEREAALPECVECAGEAAACRSCVEGGPGGAGLVSSGCGCCLACMVWEMRV